MIKETVDGFMLTEHKVTLLPLQRRHSSPILYIRHLV